MLARAAGFRVYATSRDDDKRTQALEIGAHEVVETGERLPTRVDAVMETVGGATWSHSIKSMRPGGTLVVCGATSGDASPAELTRIFFQQMRVHGSTMGTREELHRLAQFMDVTGVRPLIDRELPMEKAADGIQAVADGDVFGKIVLTL
jgi:NADPH:quinone reductase-like Zn-dependent oxidoreductase